MAVLVEAISVVIRVEAINTKYPGGWPAFRDDAPNKTLCCDNEIARLGFMSPDDVEAFINGLAAFGIVYMESDQAIDLVVVDQQRGPACQCDWVEFGSTTLSEDKKNWISVARLADSKDNVFMHPDGWTYEGSLSEQFGFVPNKHKDKSLKFLRKEGSLDVYMNELTGKEVYTGRTS